MLAALVRDVGRERIAAPEIGVTHKMLSLAGMSQIQTPSLIAH
jgi:hypothetical protein